MRNILLIAITVLIAVSTGLSLEPMKVAFYTTNTGLQTVRAEIKDNSSGTTLFVGEDYTRTPNGNGIIIIDLKDHVGANGSLSGVATTAINTSVTVDIYVGITLFSQYRLDALLMAQAQNGILDLDGNLAPPENGNGNVGTDELRWSSAYFEGNTVHIGPPMGENDDIEMRLSYDDNTNTGSIAIDDEDIITATGEAVTIDGITVGQGEGNIGTNTVVGKNALTSNSAKQRNTAIGNQSLQTNLGEYVTAVGFNSANGNQGDRVAAFGNEAAFQNSGDSVAAFGNSAGYQNTGRSLTAVGYHSANGNGGNDVTAVGNGAARANTVDNVIAIGVEAGDGNTNDNVILIGNGVSATADNQVVIGDANIEETQLNGIISNGITEAIGYVELSEARTSIIRYNGPSILSSNILPDVQNGSIIYIVNIDNGGTFQVLGVTVPIDRMITLVKVDNIWIPSI